jgi:hypothetical protein
MALYCVACGKQQPDDDPPLKPGVVCVGCKQSDTFTTLAPPTKLRPWVVDIASVADKRYLKSLKISPD